MEQIPVLIIGAGPTGLAFACNLVRFGIKFRIIESQLSPSKYSRAMGIQARTLECLADIGVIGKLLEKGKKIYSIQGYIDGEKIIQLVTHSLEKLNTQYQYLLSIPQSTTESILEEHLLSCGVKVERGVSFHSIEENDLKVKVVKEGTGEEIINPQYLIACDGAHSALRKALNIEFKGHADTHHFLLADLEIDWKYTDSSVHLFLSKKGTFGFIPFPESKLFRLVTPLHPTEMNKEINFDLLKSVIKSRNFWDKLTINNIDWISKFSIQYRHATNFRKGSVFLLGDAAHIHSPVGGQGMNLGIQDAANLAWKIALVLQGTGRKEILDSYVWERKPISLKILRGTETATRIVAMTFPLARILRNQLVKLIVKFKAFNDFVASRASQLRHSYKASPLSYSFQVPFIKGWYRFRSAPVAGDRMPDVRSIKLGPNENSTYLYSILKEPVHHLLIFLGQNFAEDIPEDYYQLASNIKHYYGKLIIPHLVVPFDQFPFPHSWRNPVLYDTKQRMHAVFGASTSCLYLIRPDKYIAFRSHPMDEEALFKYLDQIFY